MLSHAADLRKRVAVSLTHHFQWGGRREHVFWNRFNGLFFRDRKSVETVRTNRSHSNTSMN